jgi:hypothetical protein
MPDLEQQISNWRSQMLAAGIHSPVPLDELEAHLRDNLTKQMESGLPGEEAFKKAVSELGNARNLKVEFSKIEGFKRFFLWDNPWHLNLVAVFYLYWSSRAWYLFVLQPHFYVGFIHSRSFFAFEGQIAFLLKLLLFFAALGLLSRRNFWRRYAIFVTVLNCAIQVLSLIFWCFGYFRWQWTFWNQINFLNLPVAFWAVYVLTRPSMQKVFRNAKESKLAASQN